MLINVNGQLFQRKEADSIAAGKISAFDRGYLYGDSLYEVCRTYQGRMYGAQEHLERLGKSAALCHMVLSQSVSHYASEMQRSLDAFYQSTAKTPSPTPLVEAYIRLIVTRGVGRIGFGLSCVESPTQYTIIVQPLDEPSEIQVMKGAHLQISERLRNDRRALDPAMKSGNYLNNLLAYLDASTAGYDDALLCNADGHLTEGTTFNIGYIRRGILATPPLDIGILDGITRRTLIEVATALGIESREVRFPRERLYEADEIFLTSTTKEVFPVTKIDQRKVGLGKPGPLTLNLRQAFRQSALKTLGLSA
ncbi:aminotransferase class IV [Bdellovibrionota bacterium FG-1]